MLGSATVCELGTGNNRVSGITCTCAMGFEGDGDDASCIRTLVVVVVSTDSLLSQRRTVVPSSSGWTKMPMPTALAIVSLMQAASPPVDQATMAVQQPIAARRKAFGQAV